MAQNFLPALVTVKESSDLRRSPTLLKVDVSTGSIEPNIPILSITLEQKEIKIQNTEGTRIEAKKRI